MSDLMKRIEREAQKLTPQQRVILADRLMNSLGDDIALNDVEMQCISESEHRSSVDGTDLVSKSQSRGVFRESYQVFK